MSVLTVSQVNTYIKALLDEAIPLRNIYICGEISNFKLYCKSGHMYFTLKDEKSQLKAVMFASYAAKIKFAPQDGMKVICFGKVSAYEKDGVYQIYVQDMQPQGIGSLTIAFDQLKKKLAEQGLFDEIYKKSIPKYPSAVGVATSNMGAAVEDIKNIISRRYPLCDIIIVPTVVQGDSASADIVKSIRFLDSLDIVDTIIVGRGGGSIEDLWAFNTEEVARAVFECNTPIISAVGHETDFTICDFVADLRAATPSEAAERAVPDIENEKIFVNNLSSSLEININHFIEFQESKIKSIIQNSVISDSKRLFDHHFNNLDSINKSIKISFAHILDKNEMLLKSKATILNALSPLAVLARGYSMVSNEQGVINSIDEIDIDENINVRMKDGNLCAKVFEVNKNEN